MLSSVPPHAPAPAPPPGGFSPRALYRAILLAFALTGLVLVFGQVVEILLLLLVIVIVAVPLSAATTRLERLRIPRPIGATLALLAAIGVIAGIVTLLVPVFVDEGTQFVNSLPQIVADLRHELSQATHTSQDAAGRKIQHLVNGVTGHPQQLLGPATALGSSIAAVLTALIVVIITALYSAIHPEPLVRGGLRLVAPPRREHARHVLDRLAGAYLGWLRGLGVGMLILFALTFAGLRAVDLPFAVVFATLTALAMIVPYFGALVSMIPPVALALTISPGKAIIVAGIYLVAHQVEGNIIEPLVMARAVKLHPAMVAIGVIAVERLFGFVGLIVAVPILVTVKILVEELWVMPMERAHAEAGGLPLEDGWNGAAAPPFRKVLRVRWPRSQG